MRFFLSSRRRHTTWPRDWSSDVCSSDRSGTAALHLGLLAWGVGPGDIVPTATMTFAATANAITYTGATPYFIDADPETGQMDPVLLEEVRSEEHTSEIHSRGHIV